jgi:hypothetical protein
MAKILRMPKQPFPLQIMTDQKQHGGMEYLKCLASMITNEERCTREVTSRIAMTKATFNKKKTLFTGKKDSLLGKKPVKC